MAKKTYAELKGAPSKKDVWIYHPDDVILVEDRNIRQVIDQEWVKILANSIKENGQQEAVLGRVVGEKFEVTEGHHRVLAIQSLHVQGEEIPVLVRTEEKGTNEEQRVVNQIIANRKLKLNPLDAAEGVKRLYSYHWDTKKIAEKIGFTDAYVGKLNELNESPFQFRELVRTEVLSGTQAIKIITDGQVDKFLEKYNNGDYNDPTVKKITIQTSDEDIPDVKLKRLTAKKLGLDAPNSFKLFKKWAAASNTTTTNMPIYKKELFSFLLRMQNNEVTDQQIQDFFYNM